MFLLLLFMVNVSSIKLLAVIKYFLSPEASPILNNKITPGRLTLLMKRKMLYNIRSTCRNRSDQWPQVLRLSWWNSISIKFYNQMGTWR